MAACCVPSNGEPSPTQAHALTGNQTGNPLVCKPLSHTSQGPHPSLLACLMIPGGNHVQTFSFPPAPLFRWANRGQDNRVTSRPPSESWDELNVQPSLHDSKSYPLSLKPVGKSYIPLLTRILIRSLIRSFTDSDSDSQHRLWRQPAWPQTPVRHSPAVRVSLSSGASVSTSMTRCQGG